jgi:hypothetical protein
VGFVIEHLTAFIAVDPNDGDEGLIGLPLPGSNALTMPAIAADDKRAKILYPLVERYCTAIGVKFRVIRLHSRTDVTKEYEESL